MQQELTNGEILSAVKAAFEGCPEGMDIEVYVARAVIAAHEAAQPAGAEVLALMAKHKAQDAEIAALRQSDWQPLTPSLLLKFETESMGPHWLALNGVPTPIIGEYEWRQGRNPHGFNTDSDGRVSASVVTHVMPFVSPPLPMAQAVQPENEGTK